MTSKHLDLATYRGLLAGTLEPGLARDMAQHLDAECSVCEAFLSGLPPDALDGTTDAALTQLAPPAAEAAGNDIEYARIRRAVTGKRSVTWRVTRFAAVAATLLVFAGGGLVAIKAARQTNRGEEGIKGRGGQVVPARLRFAVVDAGGGATQLDHGATGAVVPEGASLAFRVEVGRPAHVAVMRVGGAESEVVWKQFVDKAGAVDVSDSGRPAAYPLKGLTGKQRFVLVASERPIGEHDIAQAIKEARGLTASGGDPRPYVMTLDVVEVTVR